MLLPISLKKLIKFSTFNNRKKIWKKYWRMIGSLEKMIMEISVKRLMLFIM
tara:strand:+ start:883 stop:1035 length:153 start_codon:yes stop_codon:yes gene_type:complete